MSSQISSVMLKNIVLGMKREMNYFIRLVESSIYLLTLMLHIHIKLMRATSPVAPLTVIERKTLNRHLFVSFLFLE